MPKTEYLQGALDLPRCRACSRAMNRCARLAHASSRTHPVAPSSMSSGLLVGPNSLSLNVRIPAWRPCTNWGYCCSVSLKIACSC
jgi:hypothetical protein